MNFKEFEPKWQRFWEENQLFKAPEKPRSGKKYYDLVMFAYPSGDIHIGHFRNYTIGDLLARYKKMQGFDVFHPFGWDAFGLPAEEAAIKRGVHPREWTLKNIQISRATLKRIGISYDWDSEVITCLPEYYRWNQWFFLKMYEKGLAYQAESLVNWCPHCKTVLANEQVHSGRCWRCDQEIEKKELVQWFFRITAYADRLLAGLDALPGWPEHVKIMQRNWIGRSEGARVVFRLDGKEGTDLPVYTTRPDTLFGVTFLSIAPEHPLTKQICRGTPQERDVFNFIKTTLTHSEMERTAQGDKNGVFTGRSVINPLTGEKIPLWVGDYVLAGYGTGIVMGVPGHDQRDFIFAKKYGLPIKIVIESPDGKHDSKTLTEAYEGTGRMVNSESFNGLPNEVGIKKVTERLKEKGLGDFEIRYKLRDWLLSRQRYWGTPIPMIHCEKCGIVPVPYDELPVKLPEGKIDFVPKGRSPLEDIPDFIQCKCPKCGGKAKRDADTMDTFMDSSWYFLRYLDPQNTREPFDRQKVKAWMPVDQYIGGVEHATMHLIYFRFFTMVLHDLGYLDFDEPATRLFNQGMVLDKHGDVMSKSKGNAISPADLMDQVGADASRIAMFFMGPAEKEILWTEDGIGGAWRFLSRVWRFLETAAQTKTDSPDNSRSEKVWKKLHSTVKRVTDDIERFSFHTAIAGLMELLNVLEEEKPSGDFAREAMEIYVKLLSPFAPHLAEEMWEKLGKPPSILQSSWPLFDPIALEEAEIELVIQINGKVRDRIKVPSDADETQVKSSVLASPKVERLMEGKEIKKIIVVPKKLVNIVS